LLLLYYVPFGSERSILSSMYVPERKVNRTTKRKEEPLSQIFSVKRLQNVTDRQSTSLI